MNGKKILTPKLGRRAFLGGVCSAAASVPFLSSFPLQAAPSDSALPKLLFVGFPNGPLVGATGGNGYDGWRPNGVTLPEGILPMQLPDVFSGLSAFRDRLTFLENLSYLEPFNGHRATCNMLTGRRRFVPGNNINGYTASGISLDQYLAQEMDIGVLNTAFRISGFAEGESYWSYTGQNQPITPLQNPVDSYTNIFGEGLAEDVAAQVLEKRTSVLDVIAQDINGMKSRVGAEDRHRLDAHLEAVRTLENDLVAGAQLGCEAPDTIPSYEFLDHSNAPMVFRDHASVITQAFACGAIRIATLQMGSFGGELRPSWPEFDISTSYTEHAISHAFAGIDGAGSDGLSQAAGIELGLKKERAYTQFFAEVLQKLTDTVDVNGAPLLDSTIVVYCRPMGRNHDPNKILWIVAGGQGLGIGGGRFVQVGDGEGNKRHYNDLLLSLCDFMGHPLDTFGEGQFCQEPIALS